MATVSGSISLIRDWMETAHEVVWTPLTSSNAAGDAFSQPASLLRTVQIEGTFGSATVVIQGSNDGTNYHTLTDPQGTALSKTAAGLWAIQEMPRYIRPSTSGGDGTQSITVTLNVRRNQGR